MRETLGDRRGVDEVRYCVQARAQRVELAHMAEHARRKRRSVAGVTLRGVLGFQLGNIDIRRAFGLARLAGKAEVEGFDGVGIVPNFRRKLPCHRQAQRVAAAASGVALILQNAVRRTHRSAAFRAPTQAGAVA